MTYFMHDTKTDIISALENVWFEPFKCFGFQNQLFFCHLVSLHCEESYSICHGNEWWRKTCVFWVVNHLSVCVCPALIAIGQYSSTIETVDAGWCKEITDQGATQIAKSSKSLRYLGLMRCDKVSSYRQLRQGSARTDAAVTLRHEEPFSQGHGVTN